MGVFTFALPAGRLALESIQFFRSSGLCDIQIPEGSRELCFTDPSGEYRIILVRPTDVPTYIIQGGAHAGITGKDVLLESTFDVTTPLELGFGKCRLSVAGKPDEKPLEKKHLRVATKYPVQAMNFLYQKGISCEIIKLHGSVEIAPALGLADCIVDLVSTGSTLRANGLVEQEVILNSEAVLVVGRFAYALESQKVQGMLSRFRSHLPG
ncbi:MAG TPA: ATP phosphoribosyltransferase [Leptospiraceae bacterium]|jgi:ATP phosphoribosyltransferase|nr:ATP phosphoribosyltransferase [Leptospirales bacterium]HMW59577.1 ATP phosphoribosyltransferase [Leptospiraceae bacterium]HMX55835.1 ATP phosphoribosyltransferase [Leptospiraceae bacterium]HMY45706.1 ATP phosphoribosyltransferase [Leptospiraceae bacterium]HNE22440.1 ATP phosphoribosyltransferase [Leptospiraceae bacterium]